MAIPDRAGFDANLKPTLIALSSTDGVTPVSLWADPTTHALVTSGGGGASGGTVIIGDGTNTANILKSDGTSAGNNALKVAGSYQELASLSAGSLNADLVPSTDVSGYKWIGLQLIGTYSGTLSFQQSNDNTNWSGLNLARSDQTVSIVNSSTTVSNVHLTGPIAARYIRVRMTAYTSGTVTGVAELYTQATALHTIGTIAAQSGTWTVGANSATGSAVPANAFYIGANNIESGVLAAPSTIRANFGDGFGAGSQGLLNLSTVWNGSALDRNRSATSASGTTGTGVPAAGMLGFDGTNYQRITTATDGKAIVRLNDSAANPINVSALSDTMSAASTTSIGVAAFNTVYNGTNYVRQRGDTTGTYTVPRPTTSGGVTVAKIASAATTNATSVKASAGQIYGWSLFNTSAATKYLKFYNKASAPTVGTDVPVFIVAIAPSFDTTVMLGDLGTPLTTGIAYAITAGVADTDTTATAVNDVVGTFYYA